LTPKLTTEIKPKVLLLISGDMKTTHEAVQGGSANSLFRTLGEAGGDLHITDSSAPGFDRI
jgi:hypothetical protein